MQFPQIQVEKVFEYDSVLQVALRHQLVIQIIFIFTSQVYFLLWLYF